MRFIYQPRVLKSIAAFLLMEVGTQLFAPAVSFALTSGPTAPEATSFEPVDTTDMVDLTSGDFTYNIPLLEVPGPEGGYPLALAYHAGIQPNEEASWVGLGWSLNPGAINRNVNGFADDHENITQTRRDFWNGGTMSTTSVGVTVGIPGTPASVSFGLSFSQDTYRGFGVGANLGVGSTFDLGPASVGVSASVYTDGYGNDGAGVGVGIYTKVGDNLSAGLGVSASTSGGFGADASLSYNAKTAGGKNINSNILGVSLSSGSSTPSLSVGGGTATVESSRAGIIQTEVSSFGLSIPFPGGAVNIRQSDVRYWSDETVDVTANGSLYFPKQYLSNAWNGQTYAFDNKAFDTYRLLDPQNENIYDNPDPNWLQGGSYPDYDNYVVSAQGLGGSMRPYCYQEALYSQNKVEGTGGERYKIIDAPLPWVNKPAYFRFENDFSNQYRQTSTGLLTSGPYSYQGQSFDEVRYNFDTQPLRGGNASLGYDSNNDRIAGSKAIEYYTNAEIFSGQAKARGFVDQAAKGFTRDNNSQIGGFSITNASGVTYHYALPVYSFNEYSYMEKVGSNGSTHTSISKPNKYAFTWYLTAVTGPDYVDRNVDGLANQDDWGYWVSFNYGKWASDYRWRNPSEGFHRDADATFQNYSSGSKQLYFLNSICTRTHTALFVKSFRADAKGINPSGSYFGIGRTRPCISTNQGGNCMGYKDFDIYPALTLKLDKIVLFKNSNVPSNLEGASSYYNITNFNNTPQYPPITQPVYTTSDREFFGQNIVDLSDFNSLGLANAISGINFTYNYSLCNGTPNSWDKDGLLYKSTSAPDLITNPAYNAIGKLTLLQTQTFGPGGSGSMPPTKFGYELAQNEKVSGTVTIGQVTNSKGTITLPQGSPFRVGDLIEFTANSRRVCCAIASPTQTVGTFTANYFGYSPPQGSTYIAYTTKNPSYSKDHYDMWGMFKSDFDIDLAQLSGHDETLARATSATSAKSVDAWSLRTIYTPLGGLIKLKYGSDKYRTQVVERPRMVANFGFDQCRRNLVDGFAKIRFRNQLVVPASSVFYVGQKILVSGVLQDQSNPRTFTTVKDKLVTVTSVADNPASSTEKNAITVHDESNTLWQLNQPAFWLGHVNLAEKPNDTYGGGIRLEEVAVATPGLEKTTRYSYENNGLPSGVTSYTPGSYLPVSEYDCSYLLFSWNSTSSQQAVKSYKLQYYNSLPHLLSLTRILPAPGVMYEYVTVNDVIRRTGEAELMVPQKSVYQFEVLKSNMVDLVGAPYSATSRSNYEVRTREVAIQDFTTRVGRLKRRTIYDSYGAKLNETVNHYLHDELNNAPLDDNISNANTGYAARMSQFGYIGMIQENFGDARFTQRAQGVYDTKVVMSHRNTYPVVLTGTTTTSYKTNTSATTENKQFDFLSGEVTQMLTIDGYGNKMLNESTPAYRVYPQMGPKMGTNGGRNMLTQSAGNAQFKVDAQGNKLGLVASTANTWSTSVPIVGVTPTAPDIRGTQATIWRPQSTYSWSPAISTSNGLSPLSGANAYTDFFTGGSAVAWKKTAEVTLYDVYSNALEAMDINGKSLATKKGYGNSRVLMTGGPASYNEIAYTGLEDNFRPDGFLSGGISPVWPTWATTDATVFTDASQTTGNTHTGIKSLRLKPYKHGLSYNVPISSVQPNKAYRVSVWANRSEAQVYYWVDGVERNIIGGTAQKQANGWYLLDLVIPPIGSGHSSFRVGCYNSGVVDAYLDDFRFQPVDAQCSAYVYHENTGQLTDLLNNDNLFTHYKYDANGRLIKVFRETLKYNTKLLREFFYQYGPVANPLDDVDLSVSNTSIPREIQVIFQLPPGFFNACTLQYSPGAGIPYATTTNNSFRYTYSSPGTYWIRIKVADDSGRQRELASKVIIP